MTQFGSNKGALQISASVRFPARITANKGVAVTKQIIINNHFPFIGKAFQILGYIDTLVGNIKNKHKKLIVLIE
jgi:hypothetical protein